MLSTDSPIPLQQLESDFFANKGLQVTVLRLDVIHPIVSGNKIFKLHHFVQEALRANAPGIITFGGPWSNHLVATAYYCREQGFECIGIVRGEAPAKYSPTLEACLQYGMKLHFVARALYGQKEEAQFIADHFARFKDYLLIPEGGFHPMGANGASLIGNYFKDSTFTHICCAAGTGTTVAGLLLAGGPGQQVVAIPVIKNMYDLTNRIEYLTKRSWGPNQLAILNEYHFGGYAKKTPELLVFMNELHRKYRLPTDFIYTGKMMAAVIDLVKKAFFPVGSQVLCIHTGGLQGNAGLPEGSLNF